MAKGKKEKTFFEGWEEVIKTSFPVKQEYTEKGKEQIKASVDDFPPGVSRDSLRDESTDDPIVAQPESDPKADFLECLKIAREIINEAKLQCETLPDTQVNVAIALYRGRDNPARFLPTYLSDSG